jgi:hypothetical protein
MDVKLFVTNHKEASEISDEKRIPKLSGIPGYLNILSMKAYKDRHNVMPLCLYDVLEL